MTDYKLLKLLKDKKVADAYQYFEACAYKLYLARLSYYALEKIITQYQAIISFCAVTEWMLLRMKA